MCGLPGSGIRPVSSAFADRFFTTKKAVYTFFFMCELRGEEGMKGETLGSSPSKTDCDTATSVMMSKPTDGESSAHCGVPRQLGGQRASAASVPFINEGATASSPQCLCS